MQRRIYCWRHLARPKHLPSSTLRPASFVRRRACGQSKRSRAPKQQQRLLRLSSESRRLGWGVLCLRLSRTRPTLQILPQRSRASYRLRERQSIRRFAGKSEVLRFFLVHSHSICLSLTYKICLAVWSKRWRRGRLRFRLRRSRLWWQRDARRRPQRL